MRLKTFIAPTVAQAMAQIRKELGEDAVIVSTTQDPKGGPARVVAAQEEPNPTDILAAMGSTNGTFLAALEAICATLDHHRVEGVLRKQVIAALPESIGLDPADPLAHSLSQVFQTAPLDLQTQQDPLVLVGPPGVGKTASIAKLAAEGKRTGRAVHVMTVDTLKAGGREQLETFAQALDVTFHAIETMKQLDDTQALVDRGDLILIDTPGANSFDSREMDTLKELFQVVVGRPILVLPAGTDTLDSTDMARHFQGIGVADMIVTRIDLAQRYGGILGASQYLRPLRYSATPKIATRLGQLTHRVLAGLLLESSYRAEAKDWHTFLELVA